MANTFIALPSYTGNPAFINEEQGGNTGCADFPHKLLGLVYRPRFHGDTMPRFRPVTAAKRYLAGVHNILIVALRDYLSDEGVSSSNTLSAILLLSDIIKAHDDLGELRTLKLRERDSSACGTQPLDHGDRHEHEHHYVFIDNTLSSTRLK